MSELERKSSSSLVADALHSVSSLVRKEVDLARAEINENVSRAATAIGLLVGAAIVALVALNVLAAALVAAVANAGIAPGWAAVIVGGIFGLIAFAMMAKGTNDLKLTSLAPTRTAKNVKRDAETLKESYNV